ncbi:hypothetical protein GA0004734_00013160 [Rhizobium sp. 9140]|nr:hypothetical protein GA0004734_00013160 [Rhizobium sp. 9140]
MPAPPITKAPPYPEQAIPHTLFWTANPCANANGGGARRPRLQALRRVVALGMAMVRFTAPTSGRPARTRMSEALKRRMPEPRTARHVFSSRGIHAMEMRIAAARSRVRVTLPVAGRSSGTTKRAVMITRVPVLRHRMRAPRPVLRAAIPMEDRRHRARPLATVRSPGRDGGRNRPARATAITSIVIAAMPRRVRCRARMSSGPGATASARPVVTVARRRASGRAAIRAFRVVPGRRRIRIPLRRLARPVARCRSKAAIPGISVSNRA